MREIVVSEFLSLDGVMEAPETWQFPYVSDDVLEDIKTDILALQGQLLGRVTYEIFASYWPHQTEDETGIAGKLNSMPKYVISSTLEKAGWHNTTVINGNVVEELARLKQQGEGKIGIAGSATLVQSLIPTGLIDEYRLLVHPIVLGSGKRLFPEGMGRSGLKLVESRSFSSGVVLLTYRADNNKEESR